MKNKIYIILVICNLLFFNSVDIFPQTITQTIKGTVFDISTENTLPGATVLIKKDTIFKGSIANVQCLHIHEICTHVGNIS